MSSRKKEALRNDLSAAQYVDAFAPLEWDLEALASLLQSVSEVDSLDTQVIHSIGCFIKTTLRKKLAADHYFLNRSLGSDADDEDIQAELYRLKLRFRGSK